MGRGTNGDRPPSRAVTRLSAPERVPDGEWLAAPSPCVGVCRYSAAGKKGAPGRCVACAMAREDKRAFKRLRGAALRRAFFQRTVRRLARQGGLMRWLSLYAAKCAKAGRANVTRGL